MTIRHFTDYQLSTTNVIAAVAKDRLAFEEANQWIANSLRPYFAEAQERTFLFRGTNWYLRKAA